MTRYKRSAITRAPKSYGPTQSLFVRHPVCGYKRAAITRAPKFYWTESSPSSSIEVVPRTAPSPNRVAMTGPSPRDVQSVAGARLPQLTDETLHRVAVYIAGGLGPGHAMVAARDGGSAHSNWWGCAVIAATL